MEETEALKAMWPANGPDSLEDICLRFIARNLSLIAEQGKARLPTTGDFVDVSSSVEDHSVGNCVDGGGAEFNGSSSVDPEITTCYHVRPGIHLQKSVCDRLLAILIEEEEEPKELTYEKLSIFSDRQATLLSQADLRFVADHSLVMGLKMLSVQPLTELTMPCVWRCLPIIKQFKNLRSLRLEREPVTNAVDAFIQGQLKGSTENIHSVGSQVDGTPLFSVDAEYYKLTCPNLRRLVLHNLHFRVTPIRDLSFNSMMITCLLAPLERLSHLSLSMCRLNLEELTCLGNLACLVSLNLSGVKINDFPAVLGNLQPLQNLQHLDLSQGIEDESPVIYTNADGVLKSLVSIFPSLVSIDISGTNLAGFETPRVVSHRLLPKQKDKEKRQVTVELQNGEEKEEAKPEGREEITCKAEEEIRCSIPGLENRYLEFLGLLGCAYNACSRKHIPAKRVTGDTDSAQVVLAVQVYIDNHLLLIRALNDLFNLFRISSVTNHRQALEGVLAAMKAYPKDSSIQIAGSASLFYIAKGDHKQFITYQHKRDLVNLLLAAMYEHCFDQTMMRNACLTLCHLNLPGDVMFCYERLVKQLLDMLKYDYRDEFIHRLGIFLLNCLACQVDGKEKELVGRMGAVETMLQIISRKLRGQDCDDVLEVAWSTLWNVTDETPTNCQKFLSKGGMMLFVSCLQKFSDKAELLRNMMGLMGNIAEVDHLRKHLMTEEYVEIFSGLLESESDGIEVSYNACGVLSHLCFDGPSAWILESPSRKDVMERMKAAIKRWPLQSRRNINYRSFEPILRLVNHYDTPIVQHWACWALCNLTAVTPEKYCRLLERENGRVALERLMKDPRPDADIKQLAQRTLDQLDNKISPAGQVSEDESVDEIDGNEEEEEVVEFEGEEEEEEEGMELEDERHMDDDDEHLEEGGDEAMEDQH